MQAISWLCGVNTAVSGGKWSNCWKQSLFRVLSKYHTVGICDPFVVLKGCPEFEFFLCIVPDQSGPLSAVRMREVSVVCFGRQWCILFKAGYPCCHTVPGPSKEAIQGLIQWMDKTSKEYSGNGVDILCAALLPLNIRLVPK